MMDPERRIRPHMLNCLLRMHLYELLRDVLAWPIAVASIIYLRLTLYVAYVCSMYIMYAGYLDFTRRILGT